MSEPPESSVMLVVGGIAAVLCCLGPLVLVALGFK